MALKTNIFLKYAPLLLILILASIFRFYGLPNQGIVLFDEASFQTRALEIHKVISSEHSYSSSYLYVDSKILWLAFILLAQVVFDQSIFIIQSLSAIFALATISLTYLLAKRMYQSHMIGLLSALFLSFSSYHIFYSRLAVSESATIFFAVLSVYLYLGAKSQKLYFLVGLAGMSTGMGFLLDRFRVGLVPVFMMLIEVFEIRFEKRKFIDSLKNILFYGFNMILSVMVGAFLLYQLLNTLGVATPDYGEGLRRHLSLHQFEGIDFLGFFSYPFFLGQIEGASYYVLLALSFMFIKHKRSTLLPILICAVQIIGASLADERGARSISVILPFLSILCATTIWNLYQQFTIKRFNRSALVFMIVAVLFPSVINSLKLLNFRSGMKEAGDFIVSQDTKAGVVSSSMYYTKLYMPHTQVTQIYREDYQALNDLLGQGYSYLLLDPEQYVMNTVDGAWNKTQLTPVLSAIRKGCSLEAKVRHFNTETHKRFVFEHNKNFIDTLRMLNSVNDHSGDIDIYDLSQCLQTIGGGHVQEK